MSASEVEMADVQRRMGPRVGVRGFALAARAVPELGSVMEPTRAVLVGRLLRLLALAVALWLGIEVLGLELRGPDPESPRYVLEEPSEHEEGPAGCQPFC